MILSGRTAISAIFKINTVFITKPDNAVLIAAAMAKNILKKSCLEDVQRFSVRFYKNKESIMKKLSALIFLLFLTLVSTVNAANFVEGMEDVPLMDGLSQITQDDISFGNEETRLLEAYLTSRRLKFAAVANFYRESLPQLGWIYQGNRGNNLLFYRDGETLEIIKESVKPLIIRITVKSKP